MTNVIEKAVDKAMIERKAWGLLLLLLMIGLEEHPFVYVVGPVDQLFA